MKLLITGDTGLLGAALVAELLQSQSYEIFGVSKAASDGLVDWDHRSVDLTDAPATLRYLDDVHPDCVIHCAAATDVERCETQQAQAWKVNVDATELLAQWASQNGARFTFISTDSVFDGTQGAYREEDPPGPLNHYARTKLAGERVAARWCPHSLIVRTNFYGWNMSGKPNLAKWIHGKLIWQESLKAFVDVCFSPLFVNDAAKLILELISQDGKEIFHVGARESCSKYEFAMLLARELQLDTGKIQPILLEEARFHAQRPRNTSLAAGKCAQFLGRKMPTVEQGIRVFARTIARNKSTQFEKSKVQSVELASR